MKQIKTRTIKSIKILVEVTDRWRYAPWSIVTVVEVLLPVAVATLGTVFISPFTHRYFYTLHLFMCVCAYGATQLTHAAFKRRKALGSSCRKYSRGGYE